MANCSGLSSLLFLFAAAQLSTVGLPAQQIRAISHPPGGPFAEVIKQKAAHVALGSPASPKRFSGFALPGDNVIPQVADGGGWQTSCTFVNLDTKRLNFEVLFFTSDGGELALPFLGAGTASAVEISLPVSESITIETTGANAALSQGFGYILRDDVEDGLGGLCVYRQRVSGRPDFEAVVPLVSELINRFVLLYDNTREFVTTMAIANPDIDPIQVTVTLRDEDANQLGAGTINLGPFRHEAFALSTRWPATAGRRGVIEFRSTGWGAAALGLRFNPSGAFTSFPVLSNLDWLGSAPPPVTQ
jgi:hypothetical protein